MVIVYLLFYFSLECKILEGKVSALFNFRAYNLACPGPFQLIQTALIKY